MHAESVNICHLHLRCSATMMDDRFPRLSTRNKIDAGWISYICKKMGWLNIHHLATMWINVGQIISVEMIMLLLLEVANRFVYVREERMMYGDGRWSRKHVTREKKVSAISDQRWCGGGGEKRLAWADVGIEAAKGPQQIAWSMDQGWWVLEGEAEEAHKYATRNSVLVWKACMGKLLCNTLTTTS